MVNYLRSLVILLAMLAVPASAIAQGRTVRGHAGERIPSTRMKRSDLGDPGMRIRLSGGQINLLFFRPGGRMDLYVNRTGSVVSGSYAVDGQTMCIVLPVRGRDCWPYDESATVGLTASIMSDRGQKVEVTYLASFDEVATGMSLAR